MENPFFQRLGERKSPHWTQFFAFKAPLKGVSSVMVICYIAIEAMAIEIVDFPIKKW